MHLCQRFIPQYFLQFETVTFLFNFFSLNLKKPKENLKTDQDLKSNPSIVKEKPTIDQKSITKWTANETKVKSTHYLPLLTLIFFCIETFK